MCGIIGYIGKNDAQAVLMAGLSKLEYRGYDSAGIAVLNDDSLMIEKRQGKLENLTKVVNEKKLEGKLGIGHTRWATHGKPSDINSHPHLSPSGRIAVVHNGIIENFQEIKETYLAGHSFTSDTDTEVVAHLIEYNFEGDLRQAVQKTLKMIQGAYALGVVSLDDSNRIIVTRKDCPLVIGLGDGENFIASDAPAILSYTRQCVYLENDYLADIRADDIVMYDNDGNTCDFTVNAITWDEDSAEKDGFSHFMLKEIFEQTKTFNSVLAGRIQDNKIQFDGFVLSKAQIENWHNIHIVACGTAYHSGLVGKSIVENMLHKSVSVEVASEFRYRNPMVDEHSLVILISQSGETADTLAALREAKLKGATTLAITNVVGSAVSREADMVIYLWAGPEISVASTKAYTSMLLAFMLLSLYMADVSEQIDQKQLSQYINEMHDLSFMLEHMLRDDHIDHIASIASKLEEVDNLFYIGRGLDWAVAQEGALKLKEISYIHAEAYAAGELKHGTLALITEKTPVISIALQKHTYDKTMSNTQEVVARGAQVIAVVKEDAGKMPVDCMAVITIPNCSDFVAPVLAAVPLQLLAFYTAKIRNCDIDQPRNLAKSVTVE